MPAVLDGVAHQTSRRDLRGPRSLLSTAHCTPEFAEICGAEKPAQHGSLHTRQVAENWWAEQPAQHGSLHTRVRRDAPGNEAIGYVIRAIRLWREPGGSVTIIIEVSTPC